jgi:hypothetical protein
MIENIALIEEVHQRTARQAAHENAMKKFKKLNLEYLAFKRTSQCHEFEIFSTAFIRALTMQCATIIVVTPFLQYSSKDLLEDLIEMIRALEVTDPIIILDLKLYEKEYEAKGFTCHTIA